MSTCVTIPFERFKFNRLIWTTSYIQTDAFLLVP